MPLQSVAIACGCLPIISRSRYLERQKSRKPSPRILAVNTVVCVPHIDSTKCSSRHSTFFFPITLLMQDLAYVRKNSSTLCGGSERKGSNETRREVVEIRAFRTRASRSLAPASTKGQQARPHIYRTHHEKQDISHIIIASPDS
jgi:hypothetical protein